MKLAILLCSVSAALVLLLPSAHAFTVLGNGTGALLGNDLTDLGDDGVEGDYVGPGSLGGFDAVFSSSDEPGFGGGEFAFNVFDNRLGPSNDKWCCGTGFPQWVQAEFSQPIVLSHFTLSSANDVPSRDPTDWQILGSNDGVNFTTIFSHSGGSVWGSRLQVNRWDGGGVDFATPAAYSHIRFSTDATGQSAGAFFQIGEFEIFAVPSSGSSFVMMLGGMVSVLLLRSKLRR